MTPTICLEDGACIFDRQYQPRVHAVLYCQPCQTWFHRDCLDVVGDLETVRRRQIIRLSEHLEFELAPEDAGHTVDGDMYSTDEQEVEASLAPPPVSSSLYGILRLLSFLPDSIETVLRPRHHSRLQRHPGVHVHG